MCDALCECLKCPAKVVCCCCKCACSMLMGVFSIIILLIVIGVIVYFVVFHNKGKGSPEVTTESVKALMSGVTPSTFKGFFHQAQ
ncbi:protein midgut expression 1 [Eupeodes corollae]|uniref:protein midgut expression 1 n=1 Tax=Eupeodes corollae TaxID=290404 RepID=UPI00248F4BA8|nr:protein midgut expression 1 [Eupeodes corollae]